MSKGRIRIFSAIEMKKIEKYDDVTSLWLEYKSGLTYYILKKVKNKSLAEDLSHEVLMKVYKSCCSGNEIKNIKSWLFQIAHNSIMDHFKKENRYTYKTIDFPENYESNIYSEAEQLIKPLLKLLPLKYASALQLADIDGLSQAEVAIKMNLSLTATKSRIQRGRLLLKNKIIECSTLEMNSKGRPVSIEFKSTCKPLEIAQKNNS